MKRLLSMLCAVIMMLGAMSAPAVAADRGDLGATAANCQHPQGSGSVVSADYLTTDFGANIGAVQLCKSGSYYWGYVIEYEPVPDGFWAIAHLFRYENGVQVATVSCDSTGGNGYVEPGQTWCATPHVYAPSAGTTLMASGRDCAGTYPTCASRYAYGQTARMR